MTAPLVCLVGNPNVGKSTLYNSLTGERARVGNYAGVTVERRVSAITLEGAGEVLLADVPGCYSLAARSAEEQIAFDAVLGAASPDERIGAETAPPALVVVVVDAGQLVRNLYLTLQLAELRMPLLVCVNMLDEAVEAPPDLIALERWLGVPVVGTDARHELGIDGLRRAIAQALAAPRPSRVDPHFPEALRRDVDRVAEALPPGGSVERRRALARWALSSVEDDDELSRVSPELRSAALRVRAEAGERDLDLELVGARWALIDERAPELYVRQVAAPAQRRASERIDRVLLHPAWGFAIFVALMVTMFQALFSWSEPLIAAIERVMQLAKGAVEGALPASLARDLLTDGVIGGVGNVLVFVPQIALLVAFVSVLEDTGYMARVAYLMDRVMRALGLHGRAFVPMLSGYACAVPAVLATRTMERRRDRLLTMLVVPLMTCSARLPVYTLIIAALFPPSRVGGVVPVQGLLMVGMYLFSTVTALVAAGVIGRTVVKGRRVPLLLELPPYRWPSGRGVLRTVTTRTGEFVREAGTVILAFTIVLWALLSFPREGVGAPSSSAPPGGVTAIVGVEGSAAQAASAAPTTSSAKDVAGAVTDETRRREQDAERSAIARTYGGRIGHAIEPLIAPLGFDWKIGVGLIGAFAAREVFISTLGLVYGIGDAEGDDAPLREQLRAETKPDGSPRYRPLTGLSLMIFFALACQCMSTLAVVYRESRSLKWPAFLFGYMTTLAWLTSFVVYQVGSWLGF